MNVVVAKEPYSVPMLLLTEQEIRDSVEMAVNGFLGLMRSVAQDAGPHGVTSNAVLPGWLGANTNG